MAIPIADDPNSYKYYSDYDVEDLDIQIVRHKPQSLQALVKQTKFTRKEIQLMYRGFKQVKTFLPDVQTVSLHWHNLKIFMLSFFHKEEFVVGLSILSRGSVQDKIEWIFRLYDIHSTGEITKEELYSVVSSIYDMMGQENTIDSQCVSSHVKDMFDKMDKDGNGVITKSEFVKTCLEDPAICETLDLFDTIF